VSGTGVLVLPLVNDYKITKGRICKMKGRWAVSKERRVIRREGKGKGETAE
jgi:hypothetical protein